MTLITNNILISFIEKNLSVIDKIGNIDLNIFDEDEKPVNKSINFNKCLNIFFDNLKYYQYIDNLKYLLINDVTHNVSLLSSLIYCCHSQYNDKSETEKEKFIKTLIEKLSCDVFIKFTEFEYSKLKWRKNDIVENINHNKYDYKVLKYLSDYFVINIFIIDNDKLYFCGGNKFIQFRKNIFINKSKDIYYPVFTEYKKTFSISDKIINNINNNIDKICLYYSELPLEIYDEHLTKFKKNVKFEEDDKPKDKIEYTDTLNGFDVDTECDMSVEIIEKSDKPKQTNKYKTKNNLKKYSVKELRDIALENSINIYKSCGKKFKTKNELIDELFK